MSVSDTRLAQLCERFDQLEARMASGQLEGADFVAASRDYSELEPVAKAAAEVMAMRGELASLSAPVKALTPRYVEALNFPKPCRLGYSG